MTDLNERVKAIETMLDYHSRMHENHTALLERIVAMEMRMAEWTAAQEERNRLQRERHIENREDRWQVWVRWAINPGIPLAVILTLFAKMMGE